jgi:very-short-patch-repair endonuclease
MSVPRARKLRKHPTWAEKRLWRLLRSRRLAGYKFRRQHQEGPYYLDFYCLEAKFAIELDGFGHSLPEQQEHNSRRDAFLASRGILVKRVWNHQLRPWQNRQNLRENLWEILQSRVRHPENIALPNYRRQPDGHLEQKPSP